MSKVDIEKILELEAKANPAPWENVYLDIEDSTFVSFNLWSPHGYVLSRIVTAEKADTQFIIAMRNNIIALCEELKAARGLESLLRSLLSEEGMRQTFLSYNVGSQILNTLEVTKDV